MRVLPQLIAGTAPRLPNDIARGSYFGGRTPEDGRIDWSKSAHGDPRPRARRRAALSRRVHRLSPAYPARILRTRLLDADTPAGKAMLAIRTDDRIALTAARRLSHGKAEVLVAQCGGGGTLRIEALEIDGQRHSAAMMRARFGNIALPLG